MKFAFWFSGSLGEKEFAVLEAALNYLHRSGYIWTDPVTQCVLQNLVNYFLFNKRYMLYVATYE